MATVQGTFSGHPVSYDDSDYAYYSLSSVANGYTDSSSTNYATISLTRGVGAVTYLYYKFDTSSIPEGATITSVECTEKCYINNVSSAYVVTRQVQLFSGTTAKGSPTTVANNNTEHTITTGSWTLEELRNIRLRIYGVRGSSNQNTNVYFRFYGATLTVTYEYDNTTYTVTASSSASGVAISPASGNPYKGTDYELNIIGSSDISDLVLIDNGVDVTSLIVGGETTVQTERYPSTAVVSGSITSPSSNYRPQNVVGHSAESPLASSWWSFGESSSVKYGFDFSSIPQGAAITGVEVRFAGANYDNVKVTLYSGSTQKGTSQDVIGYSLIVQSISNVGSWTREELQDANIVFSNTGTSSDAYIGGVTWVVTYRVQLYTYTITNISGDHVILLRECNKIFVKVNGSWKQADDVLVKVNGTWQSASSVFKKANGAWVKQSDKSVMFDQDAVFKYHEPYSSRVEYLESSGLQYIDIPISVPIGSYFAVEFTAIFQHPSDNRYAILSANPYQQCQMAFYSYNSGNGRSTFATYVGGESGSGGYTVEMGKTQTLRIATDGKTSVAGVFTELSRPLTANITGIRLFGSYANSDRYPIAFCDFKVICDNNVVLDLVPVRVGSVGYMFNKLTNTLHGNNGTDSFIIGNDI